MKIAEIRNLDPEEVASRTTSNFGTFFRAEIPPLHTRQPVAG